MSLLNEPLIYVDGVRINNQTGSGPGNQGFTSVVPGISGSISRLNDINPDEIESIEVIKGPAAATLYGTEASNGVIQILTKKGISGRPRWSFSTRQGSNYVRDPEGRWPVNYNSIPRPGGPAGARDTVSIDIIDLEKAAGRDVFRKGRIQEYDLSAAGGSELFRYFASAGVEDTDGADPDNFVQRYTTRLNLSLTPNPRFDIGLNLGYGDGTTQLPLEAGFGGRVWTTVLANPRKLLLADGTPSWQRGFHSATPEQYSTLYRLQQRSDRFTGGVQLNHQPFGWLRQRLSAGTDRTRERNDELARRVDDPLIGATQGTAILGYRGLVNRTINFYTLDYSASGLFRPAKELESTTSFGAQYYRNSTDYTLAYGEVFPTPGLTAIEATTLNRSTSGDTFEDATLGFYLQEQLGWRDRLFATAAIRADDNSAFGQNFDRVYYPKYSLSWVISEEPFWRFPLDAVKLRAAYGESGKQPVTFSALQTYGSVTGPNDVATVTPKFIGNSDLGPERAKEMELGFDASGWSDRLGLEFTYYRKRTTDAILDRQIPPSLGVPGTQPFNAGAVRNWGTEWLLRAKPLRLNAFDWDFTFSYATNDSEVLDLGTSPAILEQRCATAGKPFPCDIPDFVTGGSFIRHQVGSPVGAYFEKRVVSAAFGPNGTTIDRATVMCDDGKGGVVLCTSAPLVYLGNSLPKVEGAFGNTLTFGKRLRVYSLFDFKRGYRKVNGNTRVRCTFFDQICRENFYPQEFDPVRIAGVQSARSLVSFFIEDVSYTKFRELSFSYTIPESIGRRAGFNRAVVSLAGRNLYTWTNYTGLEPEAFFLAGNRGGNFGQWEQTTMPQLTQWVLSLNFDW